MPDGVGAGIDSDESQAGVFGLLEPPSIGPGTMLIALSGSKGAHWWTC